MRYEKTVIDSVEKCYALTSLEKDGETLLVAAGEKTAPCYIYDLEGSRVSKVWDSPGGVMTMVPVPGGNGAFLSTQAFFSPDESAQARLICAREGDGGWELTKIADLPWVHRFDIFPVGGVNHVLACTLKSGHEYEGDFRSPGRLWTGVLPEDPAQPLELTVLMEGLTHNHGYTRYEENGVASGIISCDEGVYQVTPPQAPEADWTVEKLMEFGASDTVKLDLDGDGKQELLTISPFHGDRIRIWHEAEGGYEVVYEYPEPLPFLHAIIGGTVNGRPTVFIGHREGKRLLLAFYYDAVSGGYRYDVVDEAAGSANCMLFERHGHPALLVTNREIDEVAIYDILP